jgi:acyl carrier protein
MSNDGQEMYDLVERILVETFGVPAEEVSPEVTFESLDLDSLDLVELTMAIEDETGITIEDEEVEDIRTVRDAVERLERERRVSA